MKLPRKIGRPWRPDLVTPDPAPVSVNGADELGAEIRNEVADKLTSLPVGTQKLFLGNKDPAGNPVKAFRDWCRHNTGLVTLCVANRLGLDPGKDGDAWKSLASIMERQFMACVNREFAGLSRDLKAMSPDERTDHLHTLDEVSPLRDRIGCAFGPDQAIRRLMQLLARLTDDQIVSPSA